MMIEMSNIWGQGIDYDVFYRSVARNPDDPMREMAAYLGTLQPAVALEASRVFNKIAYNYFSRLEDGNKFIERYDLAEQTGYTADDGLRLVMLLGLPLSEAEKDMFRENFSLLYGTSQRHGFIGTIWGIYAEILPFRAYPTKTVEQQRRATIMHTERDGEFYERLRKRNGLKEKLEQFIPMDEIITSYK